MKNLLTWGGKQFRIVEVELLVDLAHAGPHLVAFGSLGSRKWSRGRVAVYRRQIGTTHSDVVCAWVGGMRFGGGELRAELECLRGKKCAGYEMGSSEHFS